MSLRIWMPLTSDLRNIGVEPMTIPSLPSTASFVDGKLGKCLTASSSTNIDFICPGLPDILAEGRAYTLTCWVKSADISAWCIRLASGSGLWYGNNNSNPRWVINDCNNNGKRITSQEISSDTANWHHIACVVDKTVPGVGTCINYIDGELDASYPTAEWNTTSLTPEAGTTFRINPYIAKLNDIRLYDHALSKKEVQLIARGLICHYKLDGFGGLPNLYDFESIKSKWVADGTTCVDYTDPVYGNVLKANTTTANKRIYRLVQNVWFSGQTYTVSFLAKASQNGAVCKLSRSNGDWTSDIPLTTEWKRYSGQINCTLTPSDNYGTLTFRLVDTNIDYYLTQVKLELGSKRTVYMPGVGDSNYNRLGYDSVTEYDVSGNGYDGTKTGTFTYDANSARYSVSTSFDGSTNYIEANPLPAETKSISIWVKTSWTTPSNHSILVIDKQGGLSIGLSTGGNIITNVDSAGTRYAISSTNYTANQWNHIVVVKTSDATKNNVYVNGVLASGSATSYWGTDLAKLNIGNLHVSGAYTNFFNGQLSDFRAYATALSADDVKELYEVGASIANNGTVMGYSLEEV